MGSHVETVYVHRRKFVWRARKLHAGSQPGVLNDQVLGGPMPRHRAMQLNKWAICVDRPIDIPQQRGYASSSDRTPPALRREDQNPMIITTAFNPTWPPASSLPEAAAGSSVPDKTTPPRVLNNGARQENPSGAAVILPFRRRSVRQPNDRNLGEAVDFAVRLLVAGHLNDAEHRFRELSTVARSGEPADRQAGWHLPSWVGVVVCHALRNEWLSAEMAACEHLSEMDVADVADAYIAAVALGNEWLVNLPEHHVVLDGVDRSTELRRFPRSTPPRESAHPDPARDYAYALVSALRFRLGSGDS